MEQAQPRAEGRQGCKELWADQAEVRRFKSKGAHGCYEERLQAKGAEISKTVQGGGREVELPLFCLHGAASAAAQITSSDSPW